VEPKHTEGWVRLNSVCVPVGNHGSPPAQRYRDLQQHPPIYRLCYSPGESRTLYSWGYAAPALSKASITGGCIPVLQVVIAIVGFVEGDVTAGIVSLLGAFFAGTRAQSVWGGRQRRGQGPAPGSLALIL
jgi:hypothetical protein